MLILKPAMIEFMEAGIMTLKKIFTLDPDSNRALLINSTGIVFAPKWVFTQRGKSDAKAIENILEKFPIPNKVMNKGNIATGGKALKIFKIGVNR